MIKLDKFKGCILLDVSKVVGGAKIQGIKGWSDGYTSYYYDDGSAEVCNDDNDDDFCETYP